MNLDEQLNSIIQETFDKWAKTSEAQARECILQAIKSGDFMQFVRTDGAGGCLSYVPYRERAALMRENELLRDQISKIKACLEISR